MIDKNWKTILSKHWSSWIYYLVILVSIIPDSFQFLEDNLQISPLLFTILGITGLIAKVIVQEIQEDKDGK